MPLLSSLCQSRGEIKCLCYRRCVKMTMRERFGEDVPSNSGLRSVNFKVYAVCTHI